MQHQLSNGFVYIATLERKYAMAACLSAASLKEHFPEAHITLFTTPDMIAGLDVSDFDSIVTDDVPVDKRAKLWALSRTPYAITAYVDADTMIHSSEISNIFEQLGDDDIIFTRIRRYNSNMDGYLDDPEYTRHGGLFVYNNKPETLKFMSDWWIRWTESRSKKTFALTYPDHPVRMMHWDQFFLYYLIKYTNHGLNIGFFKEDARWNFVAGYRREELNGKTAIIEHYTLK